MGHKCFYIDSVSGLIVNLQYHSFVCCVPITKIYVIVHFGQYSKTFMNYVYKLPLSCLTCASLSGRVTNADRFLDSFPAILASWLESCKLCAVYSPVSSRAMSVSSFSAGTNEKKKNNSSQCVDFCSLSYVLSVKEE